MVDFAALVIGPNPHGKAEVARGGRAENHFLIADSMRTACRNKGLEKNALLVIRIQTDPIAGAVNGGRNRNLNS
jgi:hypothetical protein